MFCENELTKTRIYIGFDTVLNVWDSGHDVVQRGDVCDDGFLIWMRNIYIYKEKEDVNDKCIGFYYTGH